METGSNDKTNMENDLYLPQTDSFWEIGKYNRAVKRCDDGNKLTSDLISMLNERAELEKAFSKMLKSWSKKWSDYVAKSSEFGSMTTAWKAIMGEADASAEIHQSVNDELQNDLIPAIKSWQKTKYVKSMMHIKPTKDFDEEFKRAQKPWAKLYVKVDKYKRDYHTATKNLKMAETQENNSKLDGSVPLDQRAKATEKLDKCRKEKEAAKTKYNEGLQELNRANPKYMDDMNDVFSRCQTFEKDRLVKFREFFGATEKCLDLSHRLQSANFQQFSQIIKNCDADKDLIWWSEIYGAGMKMNWPTFEESTNLVHQQQQNRFSHCANDLSMGNDTYNRRQLAHFVSQTSATVAYDTRVLVVDSYATIRRSMRRTAAVVTRVRRDLAKREEYTEAQRTLSRRAKGDLDKENPVVVTAIRSNTNPSSNIAPVDNRSSTNNAAYNEEAESASASPYTTAYQPTSAPADVSPSWATNSWTNDYGTGTSNNGHSSLPAYPTNNIPAYQTSYPPTANPFYEEDDINNGDSLSSSHQPLHQSPTSAGGSSLDSSAGVSVRALYDYDAQEEDELSFKQGDIFTKIEDEDDQGWCKGRVGNRIGLYPATYVESL
ncbi:unnamed protein product [Rotaria magnacalcarata]|uniref:Uncharacterized protein n=1 Tax=Rotaria magnacalcarata TaxID=392030 RepID=A0A816HBI4_9BILA|nr:unnamed protein product [Rotaria magnacalcarata]CAF1684811.1 unnamed protein product [Rotaria magnacalcarata]CAF1947514.1 unnamed protein product [Rotaria magnacalcarata]CAF3936872.1 unnamed protein product [Rotaria magnacalcarata]CAF3964323.1 unnamed protein product [Rotaria magnacalcarata]